MTGRTGKAGSAGQRVPNPFESTEDTSTEGTPLTPGADPVFPVRRFVIEDRSATVRTHGHRLTTYGWVREEQGNG